MESPCLHGADLNSNPDLLAWLCALRHTRSFRPRFSQLSNGNAYLSPSLGRSAPSAGCRGRVQPQLPRRRRRLPSVRRPYLAQRRHRRLTPPRIVRATPGVWPAEARPLQRSSSRPRGGGSRLLNSTGRPATPPGAPSRGVLTPPCQLRGPRNRASPLLWNRLAPARAALETEKRPEGEGSQKKS